MKGIRTFMLGWEFPPFISGGLGTACYGLTKAMDKLGTPIIFVLPGSVPLRFMGAGDSEHDLREGQGDDFKQDPSGKIHGFRNVIFRSIPSTLRPYAKFVVEQAGQLSSQADTRQQAGGDMETSEVLKDSENLFDNGGSDSGNYGPNIQNQVYRYAEQAAKIARKEDFEIIHAHDWMTYPAGITVARRNNKPLVVQVHSTEFDRSGENINQVVYNIERQGMHAADKVITVSRYTRNIVLSRYGVPFDKTEVVYNGVEHGQSPLDLTSWTSSFKTCKIVLFLGRVTMQKGPEYFLRAAKRVLEKMDNVKFIMAGDGDMLNRSIMQSAELGIGHKVFFTRFLRGQDVHKVYKMADLYVMPSVSEPFGIAPLEALQHGVPVLISKQSGIGEILHNALKVDFWDINEMAHKMIAVLKYPPLHDTLSSEGSRELSKFTWEKSATGILEIYRRILSSQVSFKRQ